jgi:hypothetical protein
MSITKKFYNDMVSNFGTNLLVRAANSHVGKQTNANSQGKSHVVGSQVRIGSSLHSNKQVVGQGSN